jgi:radical SAM superfamily enzyme YgiQ (UPF0313 family)
MDVIFLTAVNGKEKNLFRPLGAYQLAWYLRKFDYQVQVIDFVHRLTEEEIVAALDRYITPKTKILGFGPMFSQYGDFFKKMERILLHCKNVYPWLKIVGGGSAASYFANWYKNKMLFDYIFIGHAEDSMLAFCNHIYRGSPPLMYENLYGNRIIRETFVFPQIEKKFKIEDCAHVWHDTDYIQPKETLPLEFGRGCVFACKFCEYPYIGKKKDDFNRDMDLVKIEILNNYEKFGTTSYYFIDDTFNAHRLRTVAFSKMVESLPFKITYASYLRLDLISRWPEQEEILLESGLLGCYFGIESLNADAARLIGKGWSKNARTYMPYLHKKWDNRVGFRIGMIAGLPPETLNDLLDTHRWLVDNDFPNWQWHPLHIDRDSINAYQSEFDRNAENYGFEFINDDGKIIWKTPYCDSNLAVEWKNELSILAKPHQKLAWMQLLEAEGLGFDPQIYKKKYRQNIEWALINSARDQFLKNYYDQLMNG